jgi:DUF4097 and DUF4098 domain-containing protein YvlB
MIGLGLSLGVVSLFIYEFDFPAVYADMTDAKYYEWTEQTFDTAPTKIVFDADDANITLKPNAADAEIFVVKYYKHSKLSKITETFESGNYSLQIGTKFSLRQSWPTNKYRTVKIYVPGSFNGEIDIKNHNGVIEVKDISAEKINLEAYNGAIKMTGCTAPLLTIKNHNGQVKLTGISADSINVEIHDGSLSAANCVTAHLNAKTHNGKNDVSLIGSPAEYRMDFITHNGKSKLGGDKISGMHNSHITDKTVRLETYDGNNYLDFTK